MSDGGEGRGVAGAKRGPTGARVDAPTEAAVDAWAARIAIAPGPVERPAFRLPIGPADRLVVEADQAVAAGDPLVERGRDVAIAEARLPAGATAPAPGEPVEKGVPLAGQGRRSVQFDASGRILYTTPTGIVRAAVSRVPRSPVESPVSGRIESVEPTALVVRADGLGLPLALVVGGPAHGRLRIAVDGPDAELPAAAIDVSMAGCILVAGTRLDLEATGRARAMGVHGVITGGVISRDLRGLVASERRQRAALHAGHPFALAVVDGYGKRTIPDRAWAILQAADGRDVGLVADPPLLVLPAGLDLPPAPEPGRVRVVGGAFSGREGQLAPGRAGRRALGGLEQPAALVRLDAEGPDRPAVEQLLALVDLQRLA